MNFAEDGLTPPCINRKGQGHCIVTKRPKVDLTYYEHHILQLLMDYIATGQVLSEDLEVRELIVNLKSTAAKYVKLIEEKKQCLKAK